VIKWDEQVADVGPRPLKERCEEFSNEQLSTHGGDATQSTNATDLPYLVWSAPCRDNIFSHLESHDFEQGGLLLGRVWHEDDKPEKLVCIDVLDAVAAPQARGTAISLSMGTDLWNHARDRAQSDQHIVGWYHSHPGLGAFFSAVDRNTQAAFFREKWHLGLVVDPKNAQTAWFRGIDSMEVDDSLISIREDC